MPLHPDYGLHLLEQGLGHVAQHFYALPLDHLTLLEPGEGFTTLVNPESGGHLYAASFDIADALWEELLAALPEDVVNEMIAELERIESVPHTVELPRVVRAQVVARPGRPQRGAHDTFVPLVVERIESAAASVSTDVVSPEPARPFPDKLVVDAIAAGSAYLEAGVRRFEPWSAQMIRELGADVQPYLRSIYTALREWPGADAAGMDSDAEIRAADLGGRREAEG